MPPYKAMYRVRSRGGEPRGRRLVRMHNILWVGLRHLHARDRRDESSTTAPVKILGVELEGKQTHDFLISSIHPGLIKIPRA